MRKLSTDTTAATEVITHDVTPLTVNTDTRAYSRMGWIIVLLGVVGFLAWASLAPLDKGVPMSGTVAKESSRKAIQHQTGGVVKEILVKDGDVVKAGQVLMRMNNTIAKSQAETSRTQYITARTTEARLLAERDGRPAMAFPPTLEKFKDDPRVVAGFGLQSQLFSSRRMALTSELGAFDENIAGLRAQLRGVQESRESKKIQLDIVKEQVDNLRDLAKDGYVARSRLLDVERAHAQLVGAMAEDSGNIGRTQRQVQELTLRRLQRSQDYQKEVRSQLSDAQREAEALDSRLDGQDYELANADVKAPVDGTVVNLAIFTRGGVVAPGVHMMDLVPSDDALVVEGQLPVNLIDRVHVGLPVELMFSAFNANSTPHIPGEVIAVSADRSVEERSGMPYYKVRARVTKAGQALINQKKLDIRSGMPVELFVKTGERTMMSYLMKPLFDRAHSTMTED
ncbi:HlyD family type I secretion periplasmic adaptor subunit [Rugamonas sp. DEMB1]|uniref:HlyD family type I secretion periplasmic adaptor subunit n=1 Tax=Rugamonas sp. DEMB1 TaxID=3039386 RepID=UPI00244BAB69|nr:HlyD family type I secretion periplasmic adaptor subunit [Rugamonas sp. DEMB1]WGG51387.1 HlyD family type I secretion periplasmic adaptor subunit [Rugamonas sp. DEMB1]